jgi:Fic family protein
MMVDLYQSSQEPLTHEKLYTCYSMLTNGRRDLDNIGQYRTHSAPVQVVSGPLGREKIHFEGPPSSQVYSEMDQFFTWYHPDSKHLHPVIQAGIAHLYFVCIHPFEDGNGRIGRAIAEKILSERLGQPSLISLSHTLEKYKNQYYDALERNNKRLEISDWPEYFTEMAILSLNRSLRLVEFIIAKTKFHDFFKHKLNERQLKTAERMFQEGQDGFQRGLSLSNYLNVTKTSRATATRDLLGLVEMGAFKKTGEIKGTRYFLNLETFGFVTYP